MDHSYQLGLVSISFREHSPLKIIKAVQEAGLTCIEWGSDVHAPVHDSERIREIAFLQAEYGIACSSYGTYFRLGKDSAEELKAYINAAKMLGTDILRLWCGLKCGDDMTEGEKKELFALCRQAERIAAGNGVTLCMECHQNSFTEKKDDAVELMKEIDSPYFQMYWQPLSDDPAENLEYARAIAPYSRHIHVYNWKNHRRFPLADAVGTWRSYIHEFSVPRTLLLEFMPDDRIESLAAEAGALKKITEEAVPGVKV